MMENIKKIYIIKENDVSVITMEDIDDDLIDISDINEDEVDGYLEDIRNDVIRLYDLMWGSGFDVLFDFEYKDGVL